MATATRRVRELTAFGRQWGLPTLLGAASGMGYTVLALPALGDRYGAVGGGLASVAGIGLGLLVAVFAALFGRLAEQRPAPSQAHQQT